MISGFVNSGMGWEWTLVSQAIASCYTRRNTGRINLVHEQWWCAIFNGIALVYCFLFMEETNYDRKHIQDTELSAKEPAPMSSQEQTDNSGLWHTATADKNGDAKSSPQTLPNSDMEEGKVMKPRKTYWQKLSLKDTPRPNRVLDIAIAPFKGFTYPAVVYAGLMWGANSLVWSGVQNATAGTVYTTMYGWNTTGVSGAYAAGVIGTITG